MSLFKKLVLIAMSLTMMQTASAAPSAASRPGKVLVVMTNHDRYPSRQDKTGLWLTELTHVYDALKGAGFEVDFVSPQGGAVPLDERSQGWLYMDVEARAHLQDPTFMALLHASKAAAEVDPAAYRAIFYTGGHGTMWDFRDSAALKRTAEAIYRQGGVVASVCHGAAGLINLQAEDGTPLIAGRRITGFSNLEETLSGVKDQVPYSLQTELEAKGARYEKSLLPFGSFALIDGRIVTGQNPGSSKAVAQALLSALSRQESP
ncbi:type 1 glutamine amidotransferase domain-containing protein [Chitinimonas sp.]|uniref:type 1 glutamine amidotransferase domain-containing protein n=1 Tax=Chitinimonas sp. TaxID=1934313 RepID=UPI002F95745E